MAISVLGLQQGEYRRFALIAVLLFISAVATYSNAIVATSGFISRVGTNELLIVWAADNAIMVVGSGLYSLIVDRVRRARLTVLLFLGATLTYLFLYFVFRSSLPEWVPYTLLMIINDQQWLLFPLLLWALANDMFNLQESKRLFPKLGAATFIGSIVGNGIAVAVAQLIGGNVELLLFNAGLMAFAGVLAVVMLRGVRIEARQSTKHEGVRAILKEGIEFVREVPSFRYMALAMVLMGFSLNVLEYHFVVEISRQFATDSVGTQSFYGAFVLARTIAVLVVQTLFTTWIIDRAGFKRVFAASPFTLFAGLLLSLFVPGLLGVAVAEFLNRIVMNSVDDPARRSFLGLVPDERRGRVGAFLDGYLIPFGSVISCLAVGLVLILSAGGLFPAQIGEMIYLSLAAALMVAALWAIRSFSTHYDASMLNWRLRRRQRRSALADIEF